MRWNEIKSQKDIDTLMETFGSFKDSVITEMYYLSGAFIHPGMLMYPVNAKRQLTVIFQHQEKEVPSIELAFSDMERLNLVPSCTNCFAQINEVTFKKVKGKIYMADIADFDVEKINKDVFYNSFTWVVAKKARWRVLEGHLGNDPIYEVRK